MRTRILKSILLRFFLPICIYIVSFSFINLENLYAAGLVIPASCTLDVDSCSMVVPGDINNSGTLRMSTGSITVSGNWISSGVFTSGTGTVTFNGSGAQSLNTGGLANAFYNLSHTGSGTTTLSTNLIDINHNFSNTAGTFDANSINMTVGQDWTNTATFTPGTNTVTFDGTAQNINNTTTFYNLTKITTAIDTLTFSADGADETFVSHLLTLRGAVGNLLTLEKSGANSQAKLNLQAGGAMTLRYLNVHNNIATGRTLIAGLTSTNAGNTTNWNFGNGTFNWDGTVSTDWDDPFNWSGGVVPAPGDTVTIVPIGGAVVYQPTLASNVVIGNLTIQANAVVTLAGFNLTVSSTFSNSGNVRLKGTETLNITQDTTNPGTFTYVGTNTGTTITVRDFGATDYYNLTINDSNATPDTFITNANLTLTGSLTVTASTFNMSTNSNTLSATGSLLVNGGTYTATNSTLDINGDVTVSSGTFTAPSGTTNTSFTVAGNWTHSGGTFNHSNGKVTLDGTSQTMAGDTTFYMFRKRVAAAATLTLTAGTTQTFANDLTLGGAVGQLLSIRSSATPTQADFVLQAGATQDISYVDVKDNDASGGLLLVAPSSTNSLNNLNWAFAGVTVTWTGTTSTSWNVPTNWDLGLVPGVLDTVVIANAGNQPATLVANKTHTNLTVNASATVQLDGFNLVVSGTLDNSGNIKLYGNETLSFGTMDTDSGTITYIGNGDGVVDTRTIIDYGATDYFNLVINDANATKDIFRTNSAITTGGALTVTSSTFDSSTNSNALVVGSTLTVNGGTLTATNSTIDANGAVSISSGTFTAPSGTTNTTFTVAGNWAHSGGTFTHSSGKVTLDGTSQTISGDTTFYRLRKVVAAADTLTLTAGTTQTVANDITFSGASGQLLSLRSSSTGSQAAINLQAGGTQNLSYLDVKDNNASGLGLVGRSSTNSLNNTNWFFNGATMTWTGTTSTDWDTNTNWDLGLVPTSLDTAVVTTAGTQPPTLATDITIANLTLNASTTLLLNGKDLTISNTLSNLGDIRLWGDETVSIATIDSDSGTFTFIGNGDGVVDTRTITDFGTTDYYNLTINDTNATKDIFITNANLTVNGALTVASSGFNSSTNSNTVTINGNAIVSGGTWTATNSNIDANGSVTVSSGTLIAPTTSKTFTIAGSFAHSGGTFTHSSGRVTLDTTTAATISGDTTFYDLFATTPGKTITMTAGTTQTVNNIFYATGAVGNNIVFASSTPTSKWNIAFPSISQTVGQLTVTDSNALTNTVVCLNCTNGGNNNSNWVFASLTVTAPADNRTVGQEPLIIGVGPANTNIRIHGKDTSGSDIIVATTRADSAGNFMVELGADDDTDSGTTITSGIQLKVSTVAFDNYLVPYILNSLSVEVPGEQNDLTVVASPTASQVPTITSPTNNQRVSDPTPTFIGQGKASETVTIYAKDAAGNMILTSVGTGSTDASGDYSFAITTSLYKSTNYIGAVVDGVASNMLTISLTDPFGVVFDSSTNRLIRNAQVAIYRVSDNQLAELSSCDSSGNITTLRDLDCNDTNPYTTSTDGFYSFLAASGNYYIRVTGTGYDYPSTLTSFPAGRTIVTGSKAENFTVGSVVVEMDHPLDANAYLLRIEKDANKSEVRVGEVVTYTLTIQNISDGNVVADVLINDKIPPGFKYIPNRVLLDGTPISEPTGNRPLIFNIGDINPGVTKVLRYQLIVGAGVIPGSYENVAKARYNTGIVVSNVATKVVKVISDPLFDMGTVLGKVFYDWNENGVQDPPEYDAMQGTTIIEKPVPNVQIATEDGTVITTDQEGKFSWPGVLPGRHVLRVDERSLPPGTFLTTDKALIVDVTQGSLVKANFGVNLDNTQIVSKDAVFFNEKIALTQDRNKPKARLNAAMFTPYKSLTAAQASQGATTDPAMEEIVMFSDGFIKPVEIRLFTNYAPFIDHWRLDIIDRDTKKLARHFEGTKSNIFDPIFWDGRLDNELYISADRKYAYVLTVTDTNLRRDVTREKPFEIKLIENEKIAKEIKEALKNEATVKEHAARYRDWLKEQSMASTLSRQGIPLVGETVSIDRRGQDLRFIRILKGGQLFAEVPMGQYVGLSPQDLLKSGIDVKDNSGSVDVIIPNGDYTLEVVGAKETVVSDVGPSDKVPSTGFTTNAISNPSQMNSETSLTGLSRYSRPLKIGDDYFMFVGMGDAKVGYTFNRGNIEPVQQDDKFQEGFWKEGQAAYYLKGKILGKYLVTSSYDTKREQKALYRQLDPDTYYPIYGDKSSINYDATNTQGPLYLMVEWDKSQAVWGNYAVDFSGNEFATFSRNYYGGKLDYQSVANNSYGDPRTKIVVFHSEVKQRPAHNELLATGGSLYFLKDKFVVEGSEKVRLEVRDKTTGLVITTKEMKNGVDYEMDESEGSLLFWLPVAMIAKAESIVSSDLLDGNPMYVVVDYQYEVKNKVNESSQGVRVAQGVGDNVVVGASYVKETQIDKNYTLQGTDVTAHLGPDATVKAEYAQSSSTGANSYVSTDGGISFTTLTRGNVDSGIAYGLRADARLFDRIGVASYYRWTENSFSSVQDNSQQGKEAAGLSLVFDLTPVTRLTAKTDIQRLINNANLQTQVQVGAQETTTTVIQIAHEKEKLRLVGEVQIQDVKERIGDLVTKSNQVTKALAGRADYALNGRLTLTAGQQFDINNPDLNITTVGVQAKVTDHLTAKILESFSPKGTATTAGFTQNVGDRIALSTDFTLAQNNDGTSDRTTTIGASQKLNDRLSTQATVALSESSSGAKTTTGSLAAKAKLDEKTSFNAALGKTVSVQGSSEGASSSTATVGAETAFDNNSALKTTLGVTTDETGQSKRNVTLDATRQVDEKTSMTSQVKVDENAEGGKTSTINLSQQTKLNEELTAVAEHSFNILPDNGGSSDQNKYALKRKVGERAMEGSVTRSFSKDQSSTSRSNIFGLSGDVNDKLALLGSVEKGTIQNLDGSRTERVAYALATGYVWKDPDTAIERLKDSAKIELRYDKGINTNNAQQLLVYNVFEGKVTDNLSVLSKMEYSKTWDTSSNITLQRHKEIIMGTAYRPVNFDNLNLIARYTYQENRGPSGQNGNTAEDIEQSNAHVFAGEAVYDFNERWQLAEKIAYRLAEEKVAGFEFNRTHTWLMIHRINYRMDRNWTLGTEYRKLTQVEAQDSKQGFLFEATRKINDNVQLGMGWNFTQFNDDLTHLNYTAQGPFLRMSGAIYDRTPEEKARARAKWLDERITQWAWMLVSKELNKPESKVTEELNRMFAIAKHAQSEKNYPLAQQVYKDIVMAGQMMFDEAAEYVRRQVAYEEKLQRASTTAQEYFNSGDYLKARKLWEKVVEDAQKRVVQ